MLKDLGLVGVWLSAEGLEPAQFDEERASAFLAARRRAGYRQVPGQRAMVPLVTYLREAGVVPAQNLALSPLGELLGQYREWMVGERGRAPMTVFVRRFLTDYARNPVNVLLLVVVPVVFIVVVAGSLADFAELLGGTGSAVQTVTAG
ncbi:MAG: hypothetical protein HHJ11_13360 [Phycicoccus sp.]|nr:hypothetical protein [Phycicoccus sp.]NMM33122.1 hypothetical protein [Phycicoccus sp.]